MSKSIAPEGAPTNSAGGKLSLDAFLDYRTNRTLEPNPIAPI
jgi:hypothetical protein